MAPGAKAAILNLVERDPALWSQSAHGPLTSAESAGCRWSLGLERSAGKYSDPVDVTSSTLGLEFIFLQDVKNLSMTL